MCMQQSAPTAAQILLKASVATDAGLSFGAHGKWGLMCLVPPPSLVHASCFFLFLTGRLCCTTSMSLWKALAALWDRTLGKIRQNRQMASNKSYPHCHISCFVLPVSVQSCHPPMFLRAVNRIDDFNHLTKSEEGRKLPEAPAH